MKRLLVFSCALVFVFGIVGTTIADADPKCVSNKLKAARGLCSSLSKCYSKGMKSSGGFPPSSCVGPASSKFRSKWAKAEAKAAKKGINCQTASAFAIENMIVSALEDIYAKISAGIDSPSNFLKEKDARKLGSKLMKAVGKRCKNLFKSGWDNSISVSWGKALDKADKKLVHYYGPSMVDVVAIADEMVSEVSMGISRTVSTSITSGSAVARAKPSSTGPPNSPIISMVSYTNVASPGSSLNGEIDFSDTNGDVKEMIIAEKGVNNHNVITTTSANGIHEGYIRFNIGLSSILNTEDSIEFDIGLKDENNNVSNYNTIELYLSNDTRYATTSYSGDSIPNVDGDWDVELVVIEPNPVLDVGTIFYSQITINQSGENLTLLDENGSYDGIVRGTNHFLTVTYDGTFDFNSQSIDVFADFWATFSGELINSNRIEGESSSIIGRIYGPDTANVEIYSVAADVIMTRLNPGGTDTTPPTTPTGLSATAVASSQIALSWNASTDDVGVTKYYVYRDGKLIWAPKKTSYTDMGLNPSTKYCYTISAIDAEYNESGKSSPVCATTLSGGGGSGLGRIDGYVYREGTSPGTTGSGISGVNVCVENNCVTTGQSSSYTLLDVPVGTQTINATANGYIYYENQVTVTEGQGTGDWHNIEMIKDNGEQITSSWDGDYIDDDTLTGDKLYYFDTLPGYSRVEFSLAVPVYDPSAPDAFELGVNLPSTYGYPTSAAVADMSDLRDTPGASVQFTSTSNPPFESGRYYILVEKVGFGGPFRLRATPFDNP